MPMNFPLPAQTKTNQGKIRRVGFELEYSGIDLEDSADILKELTGGRIEKENAFSYAVHTDDWGKFSVEVDAALLKGGKYKEYLATAGIDVDELEVSETLDDLLRRLASTIVPTEIVTPPIPFTHLAFMDDIISALRDKKAKGTRASVFYAFGLHINTEVVSTDAVYLLNHIRAFSLLFDWICEETGIDLSRRLAPYIEPYPDIYVEYILDQHYQPDADTLIDDYLEMVGSRNHALDMLPIFADMQKEQVMSRALEPELIKSRPAFHYRLANSLVDQPDWSVADEWRYWLEIEKLAGNPQLLAELSRDYLKQRAETILHLKSDWVEHVSAKIR